jgi:tetratricopeptide (TPR) repeat protein
LPCNLETSHGKATSSKPWIFLSEAMSYNTLVAKILGSAAIALSLPIAVPSVGAEVSASPPIEIAQTDIDRLFNEGVIQLQRRDFSAAIASFSEVLDQNDDDPMAYLGRAIAYRNQGDYRKAIEDYNASIRLQPDNPHAHLDRGICYYQLQDYEQAEANYSNAIRHNESYGQAYYNRGLSRLKQGERRNALADFQRAAEIYKAQELEDFYQDALNRVAEIEQAGVR